MRSAHGSECPFDTLSMFTSDARVPVEGIIKCPHHFLLYRARESSLACAPSRTSRSFIKCICSALLFSFIDRVRAQCTLRQMKMEKQRWDSANSERSGKRQKKRKKSFIYIFITLCTYSRRVHDGTPMWHSHERSLPPPSPTTTKTTQCHKSTKGIKCMKSEASARCRSDTRVVLGERERGREKKFRLRKNSTFLRFYELYSSFTHHKCRINYVHFQG